MAKKRKGKKNRKQIIREHGTGMRTEDASLSLALPEEFLDTIKEILGQEYQAFLDSMESGRHHGLRVNTLKIRPEEFEQRTSFHLTRIPWIRGGYYYDPDDNPAKAPDYAAGLYYLQEPSAMTPASRLKVRPGDKVLDLCAAPGGKATALGAELQGKGLLVANDINRARARALLHNIELFGISNALVFAEAPYRLARRFPEYFDHIMVDAPCSGEGMFRKNPAVIEAWKEKGPEYFSRIQKEIILYAAHMLKAGGTMLYSTCTFSPLENEAVISHLLTTRPDMEIIAMEDAPGFAPGLTSFGGDSFGESMALCRRIWPHRMEGEGHFLALLHKKGGSELSSAFSDREKENDGDRAKDNRVKSVWKHIPDADPDQVKSMEEFFSGLYVDFDLKRLDIRRGKIYYLPDKSPDTSGLECLRRGICLGELKKKRFEPAQSLALALTKNQYDKIINIPENDIRCLQYLRGGSLPVPEYSGNKEAEGWYLVLSGTHPLGFGRLVNGILKNKYPAGWRWNG